MPARDKWREIVGEACTGFRLDCIGMRPGFEAMMIRMFLSEAISLRLQIAYVPIFGTLKRIERQLDILAKSGGERWAPPPVRPQMPPMVRNEMPEFLRWPYASSSLWPENLSSRSRPRSPTR